MGWSRYLASLPLLAALIGSAGCAIDGGLDLGDAGTDPGVVDQPLLVTFIDVWQGDAALYELPGGEVLLIDGGDEGYGLSRIVPLLEQREIDRIDLLVLTHPHADHCGGLDEVLEAVIVDEIWENGETLPTTAYGNFADARDGEGAALLVPEVGLVRDFGEVRLEVLNSDAGYEGENNDSLVLTIEFGDVRILAAADVEQEAQHDLIVAHGSALGCDVIKVPHHGSWNFDEYFPSYAGAAYGVVSSGTGNVYGHPHQEALTAYADVGTELCRTDESGDVVVTTDGQAIDLECAAP